MKKKIKYLMTAAVCIFLLLPQKVWAADFNIIYRTEESATAGEKINVEIDVSGNSPITTLGLRLAYDSDKLSYGDEAWAAGINDISAMTLVSDVENDGKKVLNISMISDTGYQPSGTMVTLSFSVKEDYSSPPIELSLRDITDHEMQDVSASTNIAYQNPEDNSQNNENGGGADNENGNENNENGGGADNENGGGAGSENNNENNNGKPDTGNTAPNGGASGNAGTSTAYQTGIDIIDYKVLALGGICLLVGFFCVFLKRKLSR